MRRQEEVELVAALVAAGLNGCEIARQTGIPRGTIRDWRHGKQPRDGARLRYPPDGEPQIDPAIAAAYSYLLGLYLGDGHNSQALPQLFPQHGVGPKHARGIELTDWQPTVTPRNWSAA